MFNNFFRRAAATAMQAVSDMIPDPAKRSRLDHVMPKAELSRVFRLYAAPYADEMHAKGLEVRVTAGYPPTALREIEHGFGQTTVLRGMKSANIYMNVMTYGRMSTLKGFAASIADTIRNIPAVLIHAKRLNAVLSKAARIEPTPHPCELAVVGRTSILGPDPKKVIFTLRADYLDGEKDDHITLRGIFMPVIGADGTITGTRPVIAGTPDTHAETLRALIFMKLVTDAIADHDPVDARALLRAVEGLPLNGQSRLKDYLTFRP